MKTYQSRSSTKFYTIEQIAEFVEVSTRTVRRWIKRKLLVAHRMNGLLRVSNGSGPVYRRFGRIPLCLIADLDAYAEAKISKPVQSTSEYEDRQ